MAILPSPSSLVQGGLSVSKNSIIFLIILALVALVPFTYLYVRARYQFPGPPVKNFWTGNLDQTMADNVHEKVSQALRCIRINLTSHSGCNGTVIMDTSFKPSVPWLLWLLAFAYLSQSGTAFSHVLSTLAILK